MGGKFCQFNGADYKGKSMRTSTDCISVDCPGKLISYIANRTLNLNYFDFLKFGKPRGIAVRVKEVKVSSNKFWTLKEKN